MRYLHRTHHEGRADDPTVEHRPDEVHEQDRRDSTAPVADREDTTTRERTWTFAVGGVAIAGLSKCRRPAIG